MKNGLVTRPDGTQEYYENDKLHRIDGPAVVFPNGYQEWWENGQYHRIDGPAIVYSDGSQSWYQNGKLHRTDGPAVTYPNGCEEYWENGKLLRVVEPRCKACSEKKVKSFGKRMLPQLLQLLNQTIQHLNLQHLTDEVKVNEPDCCLTIMRGRMAVYPCTMEVRGPKNIREMPCWTLSICVTQYSSHVEVPHEDHEVILGSAAHTIPTVKMVIEEVIKDKLRCHFDQPDVCDM